jgi:putative copper export protein
MPALSTRQDDAPPGLAGAGGMAARMLAVSWDTVRLFLHVLAATIWVGGQLTLAALVPVLRRFGAEVPRAAARRFNQVAWTAFAVLVVTGGWNIIAVQDEISHDTSYRVTLIVKLIVVGVSGVTAALHARARGKFTLCSFHGIHARPRGHGHRT